MIVNELYLHRKKMIHIFKILLMFIHKKYIFKKTKSRIIKVEEKKSSLLMKVFNFLLKAQIIILLALDG